ncbi:MAG: cache domain-containing protein [Desulfobacteraceae bacterium]|nr:cache domain-containing protein [Desulfobacteraceae bacterium]
MNKGKLLIFCTIALLLALQINAYAEDTCSKDEVVKAVDQAVAILEQDGEPGLQKVGALRFCGGNYVFVNDLKGKNLMHIKLDLIGKVLIGLKDDTGKRFFADFTEVAKSKEATKNGATYFIGSGWVDYRWPKPGNQEVFYPKTTYIRGCLMGAESVYVGAGIYTE